jgi:2'-5' RNA ligase
VSLFVAAWPTEDIRRELTGLNITAVTPELRWVSPEDWHVTLAFLGSVPDDEHDQLAEVLRSIGASEARCDAVLGPETSLLGRHVLCVPVGGLDGLANVVRRATARFNRSPDHGRPFVGHLTLARSRRREAIPAVAAGMAVSSQWLVSQICLVSSTAGRHSARYTSIAIAAIEG